MSRFYFEGSDSSSDDDVALPYPKPLAREAFLTKDFSPTEFLSSLHNRHQTLEDLRQELRTRSQELNKELLDLVNENYQDFLGLGDSLNGGEEKVEEVRLGLLGFRREIDTLKAKVEDRRMETEALVEERRQLVRQEQMGRSLLEVDVKLSELEDSLQIQTTNGHTMDHEDLGLDYSGSEDDSETEDAGQTVPISRLSRRVQQYLFMTKLLNKVGPGHPFLVKQEGRLQKIRQILILDLNNAFQQVKSSSADGDRLLKLLLLYKDIGEPTEALKAIRKPVAR